MSTNTDHYLLVKPAGTENVSRQVINSNYDTIDSAIYDRVKIIVLGNLTIPATADSDVGSTVLSTTFDLSSIYLPNGRVYNAFVRGDYNNGQQTDNCRHRYGKA